MLDPIEAFLAGYLYEVPVRLVIQRGEQVLRTNSQLEMLQLGQARAILE